MEIEYLNSILYLQYNTIAEEAHSHPVCEGFFFFLKTNAFQIAKGHATRYCKAGVYMLQSECVSIII